MKLDIGCGRQKRPGFTGVDRVALPGVDVVCDLARLPWPFPDNSAQAIVLDNVLEHLPDTIGTFNELHRITRPDGVVEIIYPYWRSFGAYGDPTHVHYFNEYVIDYFLPPDTTGRDENRHAYYTDRYWRLLERRLVTYPGLGWLPNRWLSFISRHGCDVVHAVSLRIAPRK